MGIIFIDFQRNLNEYKGSRNSFYNYSLEEQFKVMQTRIPVHKIHCGTLQEFVEQCFPTNVIKNYYFSSPNFKREKSISDNGTQFLNNVVIRPEITMYMKRYLPDNTSVILIGDIQEGDTVKSFVVKGIEFIDEFITSANDKVITDCYCIHAFRMVTNPYGKLYKQWSVDRPSYENSVFTPDFIADLIQNCFPMSYLNRLQVLKMYENWNEYLTFRQNYLIQQSLKDFKISQAEFITAYSVNRQTYDKMASSLEAELLVMHEDFKKGEQILLRNPIGESEILYLVVTHFDYNRKEFLASRVQDKKGNWVHPTEKSLRAFVSNNISLAKQVPTKETYDKVLENAISLDDRYKLIFQDIEPNCDDLKSQSAQQLNQIHESIFDRYQVIIKNELSIILQKEQVLLEQQLKQKVSDFEDDFNKKIIHSFQQNDHSLIQEKLKGIRLQKQNELGQIVNQKIKKLNKKSKEFDNQKKELEILAKQELLEYMNSIDLKKMYIDKLEIEKQALISNTMKSNQEIYNSIEKAKRKELTFKYDTAITIEKDKKKIEINEKLINSIAQRIDKETIRRFSVYFKVNNDDPEKLSRVKFDDYPYLIFNNRAESSKIQRQRTALDNFFEGNVKNPNLSTYLFAPKELKQNYYDFSNWKWFLESLNDKQKEAVQKAVSSRGIFLLQGPPGTGKTQVIAEIVGHLVQDGKKVLIASETHKAIDNVFERLPLLADIRPLRLISSKSGKDSEFGPEDLVDNFYENIAENMQIVIRNYEKFGEYRDNFYENITKLQLMNNRIVKNKGMVESIESDIKSLVSQVDKHKVVKQQESDVLDSLLKDKDILIRTRRSIERVNIHVDSDIDGKAIHLFIQECNKLLKKYPEFIHDESSAVIKNILLIDMKTVYEETNAINASTSDLEKFQLISEIRSQLKEYKDEYDEWRPGTEDYYKPLQKKLKNLLENPSSELIPENLKIAQIVDSKYLEKAETIRSSIEEVKLSLYEIQLKHIKLIEQRIEKFEEELSSRRQSVEKINQHMIKISESIRVLQENTDYASILEDESRIRRDVAKFIEDFKVSIQFKDYTEAIEKIQKAYLELDRNFKLKELENKEVIPIYKKISDYLLQEEIILSDRAEYTKQLFDKTNVFGITNTSRENFTQKAIGDLEKYNLGSIDLKKQGIDVVIIDEVSKSSFLDLLIPILYGKTVILVGDHRQLPPMYDFRHLRDEDFDNLDEEIITKVKNNRFIKLYEESFFKSLFEKVPNDYKIMLDQQYRSHEHIMEVYNCFYNHQLQLGKKTQNMEKEHFLSIISNNRQIIDPRKHVYFVDCKKFESKEKDSTSIYNSNEADVVVKLLKLINDSYKSHPNFKPKIAKDIDERMSVGVICTYGDQSRVIKQKLKNSKVSFSMFNNRSDSKLIISTVDDFQGDERDIIILSMVRNPQYREKSNPGFVTAYQRINVALSRARRLLIVVGNRSYLEDKGVIDLPDVNGQGNDMRNFHVYHDVISTISRYGSVFDDEDVLGGGKL